MIIGLTQLSANQSPCGFLLRLFKIGTWRCFVSAPRKTSFRCNESISVTRSDGAASTGTARPSTGRALRRPSHPISVPRSDEAPSRLPRTISRRNSRQEDPQQEGPGGGVRGGRLTCGGLCLRGVCVCALFMCASAPACISGAHRALARGGPLRAGPPGGTLRAARAGADGRAGGRAGDVRPETPDGRSHRQ